MKTLPRPSEIRRWLGDPDSVKLAGQPGDEQEFESRFASLAYLQLKDRSPKLTDYVVGFQMVDRSEDKKKAVGFFGLKAGDTWMYAPAFYVGGDMKGGELLYVRSWELFVPRNDRWVNHLISRRPSSLGKGTSDGPSKFRPNRPDVRRMVRPWELGGTKMGAVKVGTVVVAAPGWDAGAKVAAAELAAGFEAALPFFGALAVDPDRVAAKFAGAAGASDLRKYAGDAGAAHAMLAAAAMSPGVKIGFDRFYGPRFLAALAGTLRSAEIKRAAAIDLADGKKPKFRVAVTETDTVVQRFADRAPDSFKAKLKADLVDADTPGLEEGTRAEALTDGIAVEDRRPEGSASTAYRLEDDGPSGFQTVDQPGVYEVLTRRDGLEKCLVFPGPFGHDGRRTGTLVVPVASPGKAVLAAADRVWARADRGPESLSKAIDGLAGSDAPKERGTYAVVGPDGLATCPFSVSSDAGDGLYRVCWEDDVAIENRSYSDYAGYKRPTYAGFGAGLYEPWNAPVWFTGHPTGAMEHRHRELYVPDGYKVVQLVAPAPKDDSYENSPGKKFRDREILALGWPEDIQLQVKASGREMAVEPKTAGCVLVRDGDVRWECPVKAAQLYLVLEAGLTKAAAAEILAEAARKPVSFVVKRARREFDPGGGRLTDDQRDAPPIPEQEYGDTIDNGGDGLSTQVIGPQFDAVPVDSVNDTMEAPGEYDPFYRPDEEAVQSAQQAADSGLKEVFDASMLTSIARKLSKRPAIDNDIGSMVQAMSRTGTILCLTYYHPETFAEIYGKAELPDLEKSLQTTFEALGDTILDLKEKSGEGRAAIDLGGVGMPDTVSKDEE